MKYGKKLHTNTYEPWRSQYMGYRSLKRLIKKLKLEKDDDLVSPRTWVQDYPPFFDDDQEKSSLIDDSVETNGTTYGTNSRGQTRQDEEFFRSLDVELHKVSEFYTGKVAELTMKLDELERHHNEAQGFASTAGVKFQELIGVYTEIVALQSYADMNATAFKKIVKKYDKYLQTSYLPDFLERLKTYRFAKAAEPIHLRHRAQAIVSRDKLIEMQEKALRNIAGKEEGLFPTLKPIYVIVSLVVFGASFLFSRGIEDPCARRCFAMLMFLTAMWVTEAVPYFATALLIPVLVVLLGVMEEKTPPDASKKVLSLMVNNVTILILGGYSVSAAFSRCEIELSIASFLQKYLGHRPRLFALGVMFVGLFLSMWISNHTAPVLCASIISPVIRDLPRDSRYTKMLLLGLAFACNFGGMMTPISSMQNALAVITLQDYGISIGFGEWIAISFPFCVVGVVISWVLLLLIIHPTDVATINVVSSKDNTITTTKLVVLGGSLITILLWSTISFTRDYIGDLGIIALMYMGFMFGTGILTDVDFNSFSWHTLFLLGGGNVLGKAVKDSHLLDMITNAILETLPKDNEWLLLVQILTFTVIIATFVSHTVASIILLPLVVEIGNQLGYTEVVGIGTAFAASAAMALPFSSFPNVNSLHVVDDFRKPYLSVHDFLKAGIPTSLMAIFLLSTFGYVLIVSVA